MMGSNLQYIPLENSWKIALCQKIHMLSELKWVDQDIDRFLQCKRGV